MRTSLGEIVGARLSLGEIVGVIDVDGADEIDGLNDGRHDGTLVYEGDNEGDLDSVGALEDVGDAVGVCVVGLGVGTKEKDGPNDGSAVGSGVVGVGACESVGDCVGIGCVQSRTL